RGAHDEALVRGHRGGDKSEEPGERPEKGSGENEGSHEPAGEHAAIHRQEHVGRGDGGEEQEEGKGARHPRLRIISHLPGTVSRVERTSCPSSSALRRMSGTAGR